jgi:hypothetical protein
MIIRREKKVCVICGKVMSPDETVWAWDRIKKISEPICFSPDCARKFRQKVRKEGADVSARQGG